MVVEVAVEVERLLAMVEAGRGGVAGGHAENLLQAALPPVPTSPPPATHPVLPHQLLA